MVAFIEQLPDDFDQVESLLAKIDDLSGSDRLAVHVWNKHTDEGRKLLDGLMADTLRYQLAELMRQAAALRGFVGVVGACLQSVTTSEPDGEAKAEA